MSSRVAWPAVLKLSDDDMLIVVDDLDEWQLDPDLRQRRFTSEDRLIDCDGVEFRIGSDGEPGTAQFLLVPTGAQLTSVEFRQIVCPHLLKIGVPEEFLEGPLHGVPEYQQVRAALLYVARLARRQANESAPEGEEGD
jgi:hypothetical protein